MEQLPSISYWMSFIFIIGYLLIAFEHFVKINKTATALLLATVLWSLQIIHPMCSAVASLNCLTEAMSSISQIVLFLIGALAIVEIINAHQGFNFITNHIQVRSKRKLLWVLGFITFGLSSILDNLTSTIVMITLAKKLVYSREDRLILGAGIVIAANAGGAWTPIGDITTTMLWIGGQLSTFVIMRELFIPSLVCLAVSLAALSLLLKGSFPAFAIEQKKTEPYGTLILILGIGLLVFVPIFKAIIGLPPFMGIIFGISVLWLVTDLLHRNRGSAHLQIGHALSRVDLASTLFFLGILLCVTALETAGVLTHIAFWLSGSIGNMTVIAAIIGLASAVIDNVPLVAAAMSMYDLSVYPPDSTFWNLIAYCAGTGGSILVIGSAAGVVYMGLEKVDFFWYVRRVSLAALTGYFAGLGIYILLK